MDHSIDDDDDGRRFPTPNRRSVDVVISNGAFCLAPDKRRGFAEAFRVLKPGGRIAICTTTIKAPLDGGVAWPVCMRVFASLDELEPMVAGLGEWCFQMAVRA